MLWRPGWPKAPGGTTSQPPNVGSVLLSSTSRTHRQPHTQGTAPSDETQVPWGQCAQGLGKQAGLGVADGWLAPSMVCAFIFPTEDIRGASGKGQASHHVLSLQLQRETQTGLEAVHSLKNSQGFTGNSDSGPPETESMAGQGPHWARCQGWSHTKVPRSHHRTGLGSGWDCSLLACLPPWLLFRLASACAWDAAPAPATKHTCRGQKR